MTNKDYISILITNYNKEKFLNKSLQAACSQNFKNYEIIIYDDCSTDDSINIIKKYKKVKLLTNKLKKIDQVHLIKLRVLLRVLKNLKEI